MIRKRDTISIEGYKLIQGFIFVKYHRINMAEEEKDIIVKKLCRKLQRMEYCLYQLFEIRINLIPKQDKNIISKLEQL